MDYNFSRKLMRELIKMSKTIWHEPTGHKLSCWYMGPEQIGGYMVFGVARQPGSYWMILWEW